MTDIIYKSAIQLAAMIQSGEITSEECVIAHYERIAEYNDDLNAIITWNDKAALERAKEADDAKARGVWWGHLHGVPITIKDSLETEGLRTTSSFPPLANHIPKQNATVVQRLLDAGAIILGKTNLPELAMDLQTNSPMNGTANNPWNLAHTPGGSTGGGAAALAAGFTPLELGSDLAGSIRTPSHFCGIVGHKPTEKLVPLSGHIPDVPGLPRGLRRIAVVGPLARSVGDLKLAMRLIAGPDDRDWEVAPITLKDRPVKPLSELKLAWWDDFGPKVTDDTRNALINLAKTLSDNGATVKQTEPDALSYEEAWMAYGRIVGSEIGSTMPNSERRMGYWVGRHIYKAEPMFGAFMQGFGLDMRAYAEALTVRDRLIAVMEDFLGTWDAWLCPVTCGPAFRHQANPGKKPYQPIDIDGTSVPYWEANASYTSIFSLTGHPVTVIPIGQSKDGLPIGIQIVGKRYGDMDVLNIAESIMEILGPIKVALP
ncbi:MAG: amidase [Candidatus Hydrogenedentota bacterium]|nr:MAG: amidase [Candidatus Hydrogenedentota bacterium]